MMKFAIQPPRAIRMTVRLKMGTVSLAGLALLSFHVAGFSETILLTNRDNAVDLSNLTTGAPCCSIGSTLPAARPDVERDASGAEAAVASDASLPTGGLDIGRNREFAIEANAVVPGVEANPGDSSADAARIAAPPESAFKRLLIAITQLGLGTTTNR
jgi:hypothetical protein